LDEALVEGANHGSIGIIRVDAEGAVADVDGDDSVPLGWRIRGEGEACQRIHDVPHRQLRRGITDATTEVPPSADSFFLGGGGRPLAPGLPEERDQTADKEMDRGVTAEQAMPEPVALGGPAPSRRNARLGLQEPGFQQLFEVAPHGCRVNAEEPGELGDLTGPLLQGLNDDQAMGMPQELVALGADPLRKAPVQLEACSRRSSH
jgi:hypothetical protein